MTLDKNLISDVCNSLFIPADFGIDEDGDDLYGIFDAVADDMRDVLPENSYRLASGVTKLVIIPEYCDFVFKVSFTGCYYQQYDDNKLKDEDEDSYTFEQFCGSGGSDSADYCLAEYEKYQDLKAAGVGMFFAETEFAGTTKDGSRIFIQEKVYPRSHGGSSKKISQESKDHVKNMKNHRELSVFDYIYDTDWWALAFECYGENALHALEEYIQKDDSPLQDMHNENFGWRLDGTPCIIDFTDYNS